MTAPAKVRRRKDFGVGAKLVKLREEQGLSQMEVARRMEAHPSFVSNIEHGRFDVKISTIVRYCDAIGARIHIGLAETAHTDSKSPERE